MDKPVVIDLPHKLGVEEAKRRMQRGVGKLSSHIPGGAQVDHRWDGDRMHLRVRAMGQAVNGTIDVLDTKVRLELMLPAFLAMFAGKIEGLLRGKAAEVLEDRTGNKPR
jgi:hypothetical protein